MTDSKVVKTPAFAWDEKNTAKAIELYTESGNDNSKKALELIATTVGAKSANAVRAKLASAKVYVKVTTESAPKRAGKQTKVEKVEQVSSMLGFEGDILDSLDKANATTLDALITAIADLGTPEAVKSAYKTLMEQETAEQAEQEQA